MNRAVIFVVLLVLAHGAIARTTKTGMTYTNLQNLEHSILLSAVRSGFLPQTKISVLELLDNEVYPLEKRIMFIDSWGEEYIYRVPSASSERIFDLYSKGQNKIDEEGSGDVVTWENRGYYSSNPDIISCIEMGMILFDGPVLAIAFLLLYLRQRKLYKRV